MPININPYFRCLEEALEENGLIKPMTSRGVELEELKEVDGLHPPRVQPHLTFHIRGEVYPYPLP